MNNHLIFFCDYWLASASNFNDSELKDAFNKFFTLYVVYNRLYTEAGFTLNKKSSLSDKTGATDDVLRYLGAKNIKNAFLSDKNCVQAINDLIDILESGEFIINLDKNGNLNQTEDESLLIDMKSSNCNTSTKAITKYIYAIRNNIFHGQKGHEEDQLKILVSLNILLNKLIYMLISKLIPEY